MAKEIKYNVEAREMLKEGVDALSNAVKVNARPQRPQRHHRQEVRCSANHQGRRDRRQGGRVGGRDRQHGCADGAARWRRRPTTTPATARPPRPFWHRRIIGVGLKNVTAGANPMDLKRGIDKAVGQPSSNTLREQSQEVGGDISQDRAGGVTISANNDPSDRQADRRSDGARSTRRASSPSRRPKAPKRTWTWSKGMQFDRGYISAVLHHRPRKDGGPVLGQAAVS